MDGLVVVGGSAGALPTLRTVLAGLPPDLSASVLVAIHIGEQSESRLPKILTRAGPLPARHAGDGDRLERGRVLVAQPGAHLVVADGGVTLSRGPRVNRFRPAVDVLFASAAQAAGAAVVAVVLSGALDDGAVGAALVARTGGQVLVEEPQTALYPSMPAAAAQAAPNALVCSPEDLAKAIRHAVTARATPGPAGRSGSVEMRMSDSGDPQFLSNEETRLTRLACPDCGGGLAEISLPTITYYRCHVGHQYGPQTLAAAQAEASEQKLWSAISALEEQAVVLRHVAAHHPGPQAPEDAQIDAERRAQRLTELADLMRAHAEPETEP